VDVYKRDAYDDAGLPGWLITVQPAFGGDSLSGVTDGTGWVRFNKLAPGTYTLSVASQPGWVPVSPSSTTIILEASGSCSVVTFYNLQTNNLEPIYLASPLPVYQGSPAQGSSDCRTYYTIRSGDTLYRIAVNHGVAWQDVQEANHLANPRLIYPGMVLCIP
jgi:nucleoid-associated protein YgaU